MPTISLRIVLVAIVLIVALVVALGIGLPLSSAGRETADDALLLLRQEIVARQETAITNYFARPQLAISTMMAAARRSAFDWRVAASHHQWLIEAWDQGELFVFYGQRNGITGWVDRVGYNMTTGVKRYEAVTITLPCEDTSTTPVTELDNMWWEFYQRDRTNIITYEPQGRVDYMHLCFDGRQRPWYVPFTANQTWTPVYVNIGGTTMTISAGGPMVDPTNNEVVGAFGLDFATNVVEAYLQNARVAKTGELTLLDSSQRGVLAASWGEAATINRTGTFEMKTVTDLNHPQMSLIISELGADWLYTCAAPCQGVVGSGRDKVFVDVVEIRDDYGLRLRLAMTIPERDFLQSLWDKTTVAIVAATCSTVAITVISVIIIVLVLRPLKVVERRLYLAATLNDTDEEVSRSSLTEVANLQEAHALMTRELHRVRSFVPQSLLKTLDGDDEDDEEDEGTVSKSSKPSAIPSDKASGRSSRRSTASSHQSIGLVAAGKGLRMGLSLTERRVSIIALNFKGFHTKVSEVVPAVLISYHAKLLQSVQDATVSQLGVLDNFSGDRFLLQFGAVKAMASHATRAATTALKIQKTLEDLALPGYCGLSMGIASGRALCGNMGTDGIKRFTVVGAVMNQAHALESLTKRYADVSMLASFDAYDALQFEYRLQIVDVLKLPFARAPQPIANLTGTKSAGEADEWMYMIEKSDSKCTTAAINEAFINLSAGRVDEAAAAIQDMEPSVIGQSATLRRLQELIQLGDNAGMTATEKLGDFYNDCLLRPMGRAVA